MHAQSIEQWTHEHVFLGQDHRRNERRTQIVIVLCGAMMVAEIVGVTLPRPRDQIATKADEAFARYREHLLGLVMSRR